MTKLTCKGTSKVGVCLSGKQGGPNEFLKVQSTVQRKCALIIHYSYLPGMDSRAETDFREDQARRAHAGLFERTG